MSVERPTFSESWYRVAELRPRLRSTVQIYRQHFRGRMWHVLQDPGSNQFFRLNEPAYQFVAMLDGRHKVANVWRVCNEELGDEAPTQGEVIQLLGQLYVSNLLQAELPPDAEAMFSRYQKRVRREIKGYMTNLLFVRIPLIDPDHFLNRWVALFGKVFTVPGLLLWIAILAVGLYHVAGRADDLFRGSMNIFNPANLPLLYGSMVFIKVFHEFGHAFSCKRFGVKSGTGGEVHTMGVMLLVFMPLPYVDASSAWAFRSKWHRIIVGTSGMMVELAIAAIAAVVWANTPDTAPIHQVCYNIMFIASVSSLLFNGNPLLRYDAYYIFSDIVEIPNLWQRSRQYLYYLVKKYLWNVKRARNPAHTVGERAWMFVYAVASTIYRLFILVMILLFLSNRLPPDLIIVALGFAVMGFIAMFLVPAWKFVHYLATHQELLRVRGRAVVSTLIFVGAIVFAVGVMEAPDRSRVEGVVEPARLLVVHAAEDGFVTGTLASGADVRNVASVRAAMVAALTDVSGLRVPPPVGALGARETLILQSESPELVSTRARLAASREHLQAAWRLEQTRDISAAQRLAFQIEALDEQIALVDEQLKSLKLSASLEGTWVSPEIERLPGMYVRRGNQIGVLASLDRVIVRAVAGQDVDVYDASDRVEMRVKGRADLKFDGTITKRLKVGQERLPSAALGYAAGGQMAVTKDDPKGTRTPERFFELHITPDSDAVGQLLSGQRLVIRLEMKRKPYVVQWWRALQQLIQKRLYI